MGYKKQKLSSSQTRLLISTFISALSPVLQCGVQKSTSVLPFIKGIFVFLEIYLPRLFVSNIRWLNQIPTSKLSINGTNMYDHSYEYFVFTIYTLMPQSKIFVRYFQH